MHEHSTEKEAALSTELLFTQVALAHTSGRLDRDSAAKLVGCNAEAFARKLDAYIDAIHDVDWEEQKPYTCNLCGEKEDGESAIGFSIPEDAQAHLVFRLPGEAPHHLCYRCLKSSLTFGQSVVRFSKDEGGEEEVVFSINVAFADAVGTRFGVIAHMSGASSCEAVSKAEKHLSSLGFRDFRWGVAMEKKDS